MSNFDIRFIIPIFINCLKFISEALPWGFDAFHVVDPNRTSWTKISFLVFMLLFFSFTSITVSPTRRRPNSAFIRFRLQNFSPQVAVSLLASLFFPQTLFWFLYPSILILNHLLGLVNVRLLALPSWNLRISSTLTYDYHHQEDDIDLEAQAAPVHPVPVGAVDHISPEDGDDDSDGDSHPEANDENMEALTTASVTQSHHDG
ncbi:hypothetical protein TIFTF001_035482 [Ficus carica]|uniref:Uncharacterized protein n=1 Tax=Ficus carica TaxID=3494 RepID=A0AA88E2C8_FICCA|nr:hypothetical protein TIFTF001_035482 [Ficus carica]